MRLETRRCNDRPVEVRVELTSFVGGVTEGADSA
jgi:hypothetical protein